jgi:hypothetical protein
MANTVASRKQKGRKLQQYIVQKILHSFPTLTERDVRSISMGVPGEDIQLSEVAFNAFPYAVESKAQESLSIWAALEQTETNTRKGIPLLVFKRNRSKVYCCLDFNNFLKLIQETQVLKDNNDFLENELKIGKETNV